MATATKILDNHGGFAGNHALYRLDKPITDSYTGLQHDHVIVFSTQYGATMETIIVPGNPDGSAPNMHRLPGCQVGICDHAGALWAAGGFAHGEPYDVVIPQHDPTDEPTVSVTLSAAVEVREGTA